MRNHILLIVLTVITLNTFSQAPGYLGKQVHLKYNFLFMPSASGFISSYDTYQGETPSIFNTQHNLSLAYVISINKSIFVEYSSTNMVRGNLLTQAETKANNYGSYDNYYETANFQQQIFAAGIRLFNNNNIAPLGVYSQFSFGYVSSTITGTHSNKDYSMSNFRFGYALGVQRVLFDIITIDLGFHTYLNFVNPIDFSVSNNDEGNIVEVKSYF